MKTYQYPSAELVKIDTRDIMQTSSLIGDGAQYYQSSWDGKLSGMNSDWGMDG